jgi:hypothetical protein
VNRENAVALLNVVADAVDPNAIIAGGYARDTILGRAPKDIDIYLHVEHEDAVMVQQQVAAALLVRGIPYVMGEVFEANEDDNVGYLGDFTLRLCGCVKFVIEGMPVDILMFRVPVSAADTVMDTFDVGLCKAVIDRNGVALSGYEFETDLACHTLTILRDSSHAERMVAAFPERRVVRVDNSFDGLF